MSHATTAAPRPRTTPHTRARSVPPGVRDTGIDFVRALCVAGVVALHALMVGVTVADGSPVFANASEGAWWIAPLSWVLQVMPLFFVIGGFSGLTAYRRQRARGRSGAEFVAARVHRLLRPALFAVGAVGVGLLLLAAAGLPPEIIGVAAFRYSQPLWFLGVFLLCQALLPALAAAHGRAPRRTIAVLATAALAVDALRAVTGVEGIGFLNLAFVWLALQQLGFLLADGAIDRSAPRTRLLVAGGAVAALVLTWTAGVYSPDLIANINPPTAALLLVGIAHTCALSLLRTRLARFSRRPRPAAFTDFVTRRTMTVYLWHMPVLLAMAGLSAAFALSTGFALPEPSSVAWWIGRPLWLAVAFGATALLATFLAGIETATAPPSTTSRARVVSATLAGLVAVVLLLVVGTTPATAALACLLMAAGLRGARSRDAEVPPCAFPTVSRRVLGALGPRTSVSQALG